MKSEFLKAPFAGLNAAELLRYMHSRDQINYFPMLDAPQITRTKMERLLDDQFEFNEESHHLPKGFDWTANPSRDMEWLILLHKFYYAPGLGRAFYETGDERFAAKWRDLTEAWIATVPLDFLSSDVTGRRIQNWISAHYYFVTLHQTQALMPEFYVRFLHSLQQQVSWLCEHLTPARNHRTLELLAIFQAAVVFPEFQQSENWLAFSQHELLRNMQTDLLADGVQCELSTDYHCIVLRNYLAALRLARLNQISLPPEMNEHVQRALEFAMWIHKPDGLIPSLSDGDTADFSELLRQGSELYGNEEWLYVATRGREGRAPAFRTRGFSSSGYYVLRSGWGTGTENYADEKFLIFDCGPLGTGNHGHFDLLSFELAAYGKDLIVDPGRFTYDESDETNWRVWFRSTSAHNTVLVNGRNQTRYEFHKRKFKIKGEPPVHEMKRFVSLDDLDYLHGVAHSYEYDAIHERHLCFVNSEYWIVTDVLHAAQPHEYKLLFHLSPEAQDRVFIHNSDAGMITDAPHLVVAQPFDSQTTALIEPGWVSPTYGVKHPAPVLTLTRNVVNTCFQTVLFPYRNERPDISIEKVPVYSGAAICDESEAAGLCITITRDRDVVKDYFLLVHQPHNGPYLFGEIPFQGRALYFRKDSRNQWIRFQQISE